MLRVSGHQLHVLLRDMDRRYADELVKQIRVQTPRFAASDSDDVLRERIAAALPLARGYGIRGDSATAQISTLAAAIGTSFLVSKDVKRFFEAPELPADAKVQLLCEMLSEALSH